MSRFILTIIISMAMLCVLPLLAIIAASATFAWVLIEGVQAVWRIGD